MGSQPWQAALDATLERGDFGTNLTQTLTELDASLVYRAASGTVGASLPYLRLETRDDAGTTSTAQGVGDLRVIGRTQLSAQHHAWPGLSALAALKLPTASSSDGLGTGYADATLGLGLDAFLTLDAFWFVDLAYTLVGHAADDPLRDQWRIALGAGTYLPWSLALSAALEQRRAPYAGDPDPKALLLGMSGGRAKGWRATLSKGLSDGAPDLSVSLGTFVGF